MERSAMTEQREAVIPLRFIPACVLYFEKLKIEIGKLRFQFFLLISPKPFNINGFREKRSTVFNCV